MTKTRAVLDACVMLPQSLNNLLLTLADNDIFTPVWTVELLTEVERNLIGEKYGKSEKQAKRRIELMRRAFPFAEEWARGYEQLVPSMTNDPKDRHVLAAAIRSGATVRVIANMKDFPSQALETFGIKAIHPDEFLSDLFELWPEDVIRGMDESVARNISPPQSMRELLRSLQGLTPRFVGEVRAFLVVSDEPTEAPWTNRRT